MVSNIHQVHEIYQASRAEIGPFLPITSFSRMSSAYTSCLEEMSVKKRMDGLGDHL